MTAIVGLAPGAAEAETLLLDEPLSFWGGLDIQTGAIVDRMHPQNGAIIRGRILFLPAARGSSSGSAALAEMLRLGTGPAAILLKQRDGIVIIGALAAAELYGIACPIALISDSEWGHLANAARIKVEVDDGRAAIRIVK